MTENSTPTDGTQRSWLSRFFLGGFKRWLLLGPLALILLWATLYFAQPVLAYVWQWMPVLVFAFAVGLGASFARLSRTWQVVSGIAGGAIAFGLIASCGLAFAPFVGACAAAAVLVPLSAKMPQILSLVSRTAVALLGLWLLAANAIPAIQQWQMAEYIVANTEEVTDFPVTIEDRVLPRATALEYALKSNDDRTKEVERVHILWLPKGTNTTLESADGSTLKPSTQEHAVWQAPLKYNREVIANKFWYAFWGSTSGIIRVDASEMNRDIDAKSGESAFFMFGAESWVTEGLFKLRHPLSRPAEKLYWQKPDGTWVLLVSYTTYKPTWTGTMIPVYGGVMEFGTHGSFTNHSPAEARKLFAGATLVPPHLVNTYGAAYSKFRYGLSDYFWYQQGLLDISEDEKARDEYPTKNSHPYYQNFEGIGPQLVLPFEPKGDTADALTRVLLFDAVDGSIKGYTRKGGVTITGPRTGLQNLTEAAPELNWQMYAAVEPLIIHTKDGKWYYKVSIIRDAVGHATVRIIVVDAVTLFPVAFNNVQDFRDYLETGKLPAGARTLDQMKQAPAPTPGPDQPRK